MFTVSSNRWYARLLFIIAYNIALCLTSSSSVFAQSLTLQMALQKAESRSSGISALQHSATASRSLASVAAQLPDPNLSVTLNNLPIQGENAYRLNREPMTMMSVGVMQMMVSKQKRQARAASINREANVADANGLILLVQLRTQTAQAWFSLYFQQQIFTLLLKQKEEANHIVAATEAGYRGKQSTQLEVMTARSESIKLDNRLIEIRSNIANAQITLARWVGDASNSILDLSTSKLPVMKQTDFNEKSLTHHLEQHADLLAMDAKEQLAIAEVNVEKQEKNADWSYSMMLGKRDSRYGDMLSIGVSIPIQWNQKNRQDKEIFTKLIKVDQVREEKEEMRREHAAQVQSWLVNWRSLFAQLDNYDQALLPLSQARIEASLAAYRGGNGSLSTVLETRQTLLEQQIERLGLELDIAKIWANLELITPPNTSSNLKNDLSSNNQNAITVRSHNE